MSTSHKPGPKVSGQATQGGYVTNNWIKRREKEPKIIEGISRPESKPDGQNEPISYDDYDGDKFPNESE